MYGFSYYVMQGIDIISVSIFKRYEIAKINSKNTVKFQLIDNM